MGLDELIFYDSKGIFPETYESEKEFLNRAEFVYKQKPICEYFDILKKSETVIRFADKEMTLKAAKDVEKRFKCDFSWINIFLGNLDSGVAGKCHNIFLKKYGFYQPFVILDYLLGDNISTARHEFIHAARTSAPSIGGYPSISFYGNQINNMEETISDSFEGIFSFHSFFASWNLMRARNKLDRQIGKDFADYVIIRSNIDEIIEFYSRNGYKDARSLICKKAGVNLKYYIMKNRIGL
jgi:hypothetical protein